MTEHSDTWGGDGHGAGCPCCCDPAASAFETSTFDDPVFDGTVDDGPAWEQPAWPPTSDDAPGYALPDEVQPQEWQPVADLPGPVAPEVPAYGSSFVGGHSITDGIEPGGYGSSVVGGHSITDGIEPGGYGSSVVGGYSITDGIEAGGYGSSVVGGHLITDSTQPGGFGGATIGGVTAAHQAYLAANGAIEAEAAQRAALGNAGYLQANGFVGGEVTSDPVAGPHPGVLMQQLAQLHRTEVNNAETVIYGGRITNPYLTE